MRGGSRRWIHDGGAAGRRCRRRSGRRCRCNVGSLFARRKERGAGQNTDGFLHRFGLGLSFGTTKESAQERRPVLPNSMFVSHLRGQQLCSRALDADAARQDRTPAPKHCQRPQASKRRLERQAMRLADRLQREAAVACVDAADERRQFFAGGFQSLVREQLDVARSCVR